MSLIGLGDVAGGVPQCFLDGLVRELGNSQLRRIRLNDWRNLELRVGESSNFILESSGKAILRRLGLEADSRSDDLRLLGGKECAGVLDCLSSVNDTLGGLRRINSHHNCLNCLLLGRCDGSFWRSKHLEWICSGGGGSSRLCGCL